MKPVNEQHPPDIDGLGFDDDVDEILEGVHKLHDDWIATNPPEIEERKGEDAERRRAVLRVRIDDRKGLPFRTIEEWLSEGVPEIKWSVDDILPEGTLSILSGPPKSGKSTTVACLAAAMATGGRNWLNKETRKGPVLHLALEEHPSLVIERYKALGVDPRKVAILNRLEHPAPYKSLEESLLEFCPVLVVFDPIQRFLKLDDSYHYSQVSNALDPLIHLVQKHSTHGVLVTHSPHSGGRAIGSQAFDGSCAAQLTMRRDGKTRLLSVTGRAGVEEVEDGVLSMDDAGWVSMKGTRREAEAADELGETMGLIVDYLDEHGAADLTSIHRGIRRGRTKVKRAVDRLITLRTVRARGTGMRGDPVRFSIL